MSEKVRVPHRSENYRIGTSSPIDNTTFGTGRVDMGVASVAPGQSATFNFQVKAPATAGSYLFDWGMLWEGNWRFGQTSAIRITVNAAAAKPTIDRVSHAPRPLIAGQGFTTTWKTTGATSLTRVCTAAGTGYKVNQSLAVNGELAQTALAAWVGYPSTCTWTATGPGGTATYTEQVETVANTSAKPTIDVRRMPSPPVAGKSFTTTWTTTNATALSRVCTATGTGYKVNESLAVNDSRTDTALAAWVGYPSSCTWTASGAGGTTTHVETMTTTDAASGGVTYIHTDGLGSPVARTDAAGQVISRTRYEPYGYVTGGAAPTVGFTGHVNDAETGLTYMQQRYYDPVAGRFLSIDSLVTDANTGARFNRYAYANNNPFRFIDRDGRCPVEKDNIKCTAEIKPGVKISDPKLVEGLNKIAGEINKTIEVYSGDRDPAKNAKVGGAKNSAHTLGKGADVRVQGATKRETAKMIFESTARVESGIRQVYHLPDNGKLPEHTHLDTLPGPDLQQNPGGRYAPLTVFDEN